MSKRVKKKKMGRKNTFSGCRYSLRMTDSEKEMVDLAYKVDGVLAGSSLNRFMIGILMDRCGEILDERRWRLEEERKRLNGVKVAELE